MNSYKAFGLLFILAAFLLGAVGAILQVSLNIYCIAFCITGAFLYWVDYINNKKL